MNLSVAETMEFSIVIPTYGRPDQMAACLDSLEALDYPRDRFEVIVVDDGSPQPLPPCGGALRVTLVRQAHAGPAAARNAGAAAAQGRWLAFTDDDCRPAGDWLSKLAARLARVPHHMVGGLTVNALTNNPYATASQLLVHHLYEYYNRDPEHARFFTSNNLAVPAELFHRIGRFDVRLTRAAGEDRDLCARWREQGYGLSYEPAAVVHHAHALTLPKFWRQHFHYGQAAFHFHHQRPRRVDMEPPAFYLRLLRYPFSRGRGLAAVWLAMLLGLSQVANAAGYYSKRIR